MWAESLAGSALGSVFWALAAPPIAATAVAASHKVVFIAFSIPRA
jgi:hypothetical protein